MISPTPNVKNFDLNDDIFLDELENSHSVDRFRTYLTATDGDRVQAVRLYTWNTAVSAAFYGPLQALKVALRNAMNRELAVTYGRTWYDSDRAGFDSGCLARVKQTKQRLRRDKHSDGVPHVIASHTFGFWVFLLGAGSYIDWNTKTKADVPLAQVLEIINNHCNMLRAFEHWQQTHIRQTASHPALGEATPEQRARTTAVQPLLESLATVGQAERVDEGRYAA